MGWGIPLLPSLTPRTAGNQLPAPCPAACLGQSRHPPCLLTPTCSPLPPSSLSLPLQAECNKQEQLAVSFAAGYIAGIFCAVVSHPADNLVSKMNAAKGVPAGECILVCTAACSHAACVDVARVHVARVVCTAARCCSNTADAWLLGQGLPCCAACMLARCGVWPAVLWALRHGLPPPAGCALNVPRTHPHHTPH